MTIDQEVRPTAEERMQEFPDPPTQAVQEVKRWNRIMVICLLISGVAMATALIVAAFALGGQGEAQQRSTANATLAAQANQKADVANQNAAAAAAAAAEANRRLAAAGKATVPIPTVTISPSEAPATEGLTGQQLITVQSLIESALSRYQPVMSDMQIKQIAATAAALVPKPKDGHTPTAAELQPLVAAAQAMYCAGGKCLPSPGPIGPSGPPGEQGKQGDRGADAPPVADEQLRPIVAAGIAAYCGQDSKPCQGDRGSAGKDADPAYSVTDMDCVGDGSDSSWVIYLNNGVGPQITKTAAGPCRIGPATPPLALRTK